MASSREKQFSGTFNVRLPPELHATIADAAAAEARASTQWVTDELIASLSE